MADKEVTHDDLDKAFDDFMGDMDDEDLDDNKDDKDDKGNKNDPDNDDKDDKDGDAGDDKDGDNDSSDNDTGDDGSDDGSGDSGDNDDDGEGDQDADDDPNEPTDHGERSKLGRKVAKLEKTLADTMGQMQAMMAQMMGNNKPVEEDDDDIFEGMEPDEAMTPAQLKQAMARQKQNETAKKDKYTKEYTDQAGKIAADEDPEVYKAVIKVMRDEFNVYRTGDGAQDCAQNYWLAKNKVITDSINGTTPAKKTGDKKNPLTKNKDKNKDGLGGRKSDDSHKSNKNAPVLDKWAQEFKDLTGMSDESTKKALGTDRAYNKGR